MQKVLHSLSKSCGLDQTSRLVDIGAGLGRPLLHALISPGVASGFGIEIDQIKCSKADAFLRRSAAALSSRGLAGKDFAVPEVQCSAIEKIRTLEPATHAYSFWEGVPINAKCAFGCLFAASKTLKAVAVVQRAMRQAQPAEVMKDLGFGLLHLVASFPVSMSGSGRSFTAYVFSKADKAQLAQQAVLAEASAAQLASSQLLCAQRRIAESPSPIHTPDGAIASRSHAESACTVSMYASNATEEEDAKNASKAMTRRMARHGTDKSSIVECSVVEGVRAKSSATECHTDPDCMAEVESECQIMLRCQPAESNACEEVEQGRASSKSLGPVSKSSQTHAQLHIQVARRSQRQQQQRQLRDKQLQAEKLHTARISARAKTPAAVTTPSSTRSSSKAVSCTGVSGSKGSVCVPGAAGKFPSENALEREASKESVGITASSRKGKGSPSAGVKKQTSPIGKGSGVSLGLGGRFPLRVRKNAEQLHAKSDLNGKFAKVTPNRGLGDLAKHMAASHANA
ncbi:TPA: hypothetical protein ACH3X1_008235 [Trebouxia sp. C0004]